MTAAGAATGAAPAACAACVHELGRHDSISLRYCQATQSNALARTCICPTVTFSASS